MQSEIKVTRLETQILFLTDSSAELIIYADISCSLIAKFMP